MSGPVTMRDAEPVCAGSDPADARIEITESRQTEVGGMSVRRALPRRGRRTVGAWCFVDHMGPVFPARDRQLDVAPHPHMGLQTVTWLLAGEVVHRDSLGTEQVVRPGELNLMTAGRGVSHSEEQRGRSPGELHGVQLWVAQPAATRDGAAAFEHHVELPKVDLEGSVATLLVGELEAAVSPARRDTDHVGMELELHAGSTVVPLMSEREHAVIVLVGSLLIDGQVVEPGHLAYLGVGREGFRLIAHEPSRALLLGGRPFEEPILMWWNFVARTQAEVSAAYEEWAAAGERFGRVASVLPRTEVGPPPWSPHRA